MIETSISQQTCKYYKKHIFSFNFLNQMTNVQRVVVEFLKTNKIIIFHLIFYSHDGTLIDKFIFQLYNLLKNLANKNITL